MSMKLSLREQVERLAQTPAAHREYSGSSVTLKLEVPVGHRIPLRIEIVRVMARHGIGVRDGHPLMLKLLSECQITVTLPFVENISSVVAELANADVTATLVEPALAK